MPTEITVTGCGDCPMRDKDYYSERDCLLPNNISGEEEDCPLKTDSITIKLKSNETHKTDVRGNIAQQ